MIDLIQFIVWAVLGILITWGIFLAWVGFKSVPAYSKRRLPRAAASFTFCVGVAWVALWVSACAFNFIQLIGGSNWQLALL